ncbi:DUF1343 domain-containing protein [Polyangium sp. 15x6]|uniref:exo-beta-N-acetylmuramidase NamZ family protein n=1 Tax=Polyangium sp. 15x6 TaxID=3042687 RepID=UPI00249C4D30|nr:DUF1343 domain-containing protein [Polyangium sp. 15x6]MDI3287639.1 DUF1343 domain-containing protein [Polyangium sp. 15x6]
MLVGLDRLPRLPSVTSRLNRTRFGVLAHPASVDRGIEHIGDVLARIGAKPALFFGPEHGYGGEAQDMVDVPHARDKRTGAPIISLYGDRFEDLSPRPEHLASIDVLLIDLADIGTRYYTFVWTALLATRAAAKAGVPVILLDRPNPITGSRRTVEGRSQAPGFLSFVGLEPIPVRHSLTIGETVALFARREGIPLGDALSIVTVEGWDREKYADTWDRPFVMPSPNMPTFCTAMVYPGGCLIEGTNLSEGRGTTRPFEIIGAPWLDGHQLAQGLRATGLQGFVARPLTFRPTFQKHAGQICGGVQIHVADRMTFRPVATYTALVALARRQNPQSFAFRTERYEYIDTIPAFDLLTGSDQARRAIEAGEDARSIAEYVSTPDPTWPDVMAEASAALQEAAI